MNDEKKHINIITKDFDKLPGPSVVLDEWVQQTLFYKNLMIESHLRAILKPAPRFIPEKLWLKLAARFIILEEKTTQGTSLAG